MPADDDRPDAGADPLLPRAPRSEPTTSAPDPVASDDGGPDVAAATAVDGGLAEQAEPGERPEPHASGDADGSPWRVESRSAADPDEAGADPLLARPAVATGETGAIARPGDDRSPVVIGVLFAASCALIAGLATIALTREEPSGSADPGTAAAAVDAGTGSSSGDPAPSASALVDLPPPGSARLGDRELTIAAGCATHLPLAPADTDAQVSSYLLRGADGRPIVVDRRFGDRDVPDVAVAGADLDVEVLTASDVGDDGAFVADLLTSDGDPTTLAVHPGDGGGLDCDDLLVTNEPGRLAFPYSRVVLDVCTQGEQGDDLTAVGLTSEGGRFTARNRAGTGEGDTVELTYDDPTLASVLVDPAATSFESGDRLGWSGVVRAGDGEASLDITVDVAVAATRPCTAADQG